MAKADEKALNADVPIVLRDQWETFVVSMRGPDRKQLLAAAVWTMIQSGRDEAFKNLWAYDEWLSAQAEAAGEADAVAHAAEGEIERSREGKTLRKKRA